MKKSLLIVSALFCALTVNAQTRTEIAENLPTAPLTSPEGFEFKFQSGRMDNCLPLTLPGTNYLWGQIFGTGNGTSGFNNGFQVNLDSTNHELIVQSDGNGGIFAARLPKGDCSTMLGGSASDRVDLSTFDNISITLTSDVNVGQFFLFPAVLNGSSYEYVDGHSTDQVDPQSITANIETTLTFHVSTKNFAGTLMPIDKVIGFAFTVKNGSGDPLAATLNISSIKLGNAIVLSNSNAVQVNDQVSLFPNPAKGFFKLDLSAMAVESATVKVMNANGSVVKELTASSTTTEVSTEGLNKGIYLVQVTSANKVATKKVVVE